MIGAQRIPVTANESVVGRGQGRIRPRFVIAKLIVGGVNGMAGTLTREHRVRSLVVHHDGGV